MTRDACATARTFRLAAAILLLASAALYIARPVSRARLQPIDVARRVDLNTADAAELALLPDIGPALSQRIVDHRREHGRFTSIEQLKDVAGIGPAIFEAVRHYIRVASDAPRESDNLR